MDFGELRGFQNVIVSEGAGRLGKALLHRRFLGDLPGNLLEGACHAPWVWTGDLPGTLLEGACHAPWVWTTRTTEPTTTCICGGEAERGCHSPRPGSVHHSADVGFRRGRADGVLGV